MKHDLLVFEVDDLTNNSSKMWIVQMAGYPSCYLINSGDFESRIVLDRQSLFSLWKVLKQQNLVVNPFFEELESQARSLANGEACSGPHASTKVHSSSSEDSPSIS